LRYRVASVSCAYALTVVSVGATSIKSVELAALFREADVVAWLHVESADARAFEDAVYRARVLEGFKGAPKDATIYFGPFIGHELGGEYIAFLRNTRRKVGETLRLESSPWPDASDEPLLHIMYAGYSMLPVEFTCVFDPCDDGVSVPSSQVIMPDGVSLVFHEAKPGSNYNAWVKRETMVKLLRAQGQIARQ